MTGDRWQRVKEIFAEALACEPDDRAAVLRGACGTDDNLRQEVERLLAADSSAGNFLQPPELTLPGEENSSNGWNRIAAAENKSPVSSIEGYSIVEELHRGGQGVVYRAIQESTQREVAIKVMHVGPFAGPRDAARFEREVRILSQLKHPNIVAILDSGTASGSAYFVMDYIRGKPLDEYVRDARLPPGDILRLFERIAGAVSVAHLRGVIHRDLKPGNIRVDPAGEPHILDFGLAKVSEFDALADSRSEVRTLTGQFIGSVPWASPEQAEGRPDLLDIRTDVYSLGVNLYQVLVGRFPYDVTGSLRNALDNILRADVPRPGAEKAGIDDEVDAIVLKCLARDPDRRYQSAGELARDIRRYLSGEPIEARRDSGWYLLRKSLSRYRAQVAVAITFVVLVTAGLLISLNYWRQAVRARDSAEHQARITETINSFLNNDVLASASPSHTPDREFTVRQALDHASDKIEEKLGGEPVVEASIRATIGHTYMLLGEHDSAEPHLEQVVLLRRTHLGEDDQETLAAVLQLASSYREQGRLDEAESLLVKTLETCRQVLGENHATTLDGKVKFGQLCEAQAKYDEAERMYVEFLEGRRRIGGEHDLEALAALHNLGNLHIRRGEFEKARPMLGEVVELRQSRLGDEHPATLTSLNSLAVLHYKEARYDEAESILVDVFQTSRRVLGEDHPNTLSSMSSLGAVYEACGKYDLALPLSEAALEIRRRTLGDEHPATILAMNNLGATYRVQGRFEDAEQLLTGSLQTSKRVLGDRHPGTLMAANNLGGLYRQMGRLDEALPLYVKVVEDRREVLGAAHPKTLISMSNLGNLYIDLQRYDEAEPLLKSAIDGGRRALPPDHWYIGAFLSKHGKCLMDMGRYHEAEAELKEAHTLLVAALGEESERTIALVNNLIELYEAKGEKDKADAWRSNLPNAQDAPSAPATP